METWTFWQWLALGMVLMVLEIFAPAMVLMWFGFGAMLTGLIVWLLPSLSIAVQISLFACISLLSVWLWRQSRFREENVHSDQPQLNHRLHSHIGKTYVLTEAIVHGRGAIRVGDTAWRVRGVDLPAGTNVRITGLDGVIFTVEKA